MRAAYERWKASYLVEAGRGDAGQALYRIAFGKPGSDNYAVTVSEGQGYGMIAVAYLAGHDPAAQAIFDGLWRFARTNPSIADDRLMGWHIPVLNPDGNTCAFDGDCDIALAFRYEGTLGAEEGEWDDLVVRPLLTDRLVGLVPQGHRLARARSIGIGELAGESWIAGCPRCRGQLVRVCESAGFTPRIDFATDDYPAVVGLVGAGLGVAVLPELAVESVRPKGVRTVSVEPVVHREIVALTLPDLALVPTVAATLDRLAGAAAR